MKITYLPAIRPGELFNSVFIRMLWHQGDRLSLNTYCTYRHRPSLPCHYGMVPALTLIRAATPESWGLEAYTLIRSCCIFPFFSPYLPPDVRQKHLDWVSGEVSESLSPVFRGNCFAQPALAYRACPECLAEDKRVWGEPYLHREHHLPGIDFCLDHFRPLVTVGNKYTSVRILLRRMENPSGLSDGDSTVVAESLLRHLRDSVRQLFARPIQAEEKLNFTRLYRLRLDAAGIRRRSWDKDLIGAMYAKYGEKVAETFQFDAWAHLVKSYLAGRQPYLPPIAHLILTDFLGISFVEAMEYSDGSLWQCANPFADCGRAVTERRTIKKSKTEHVECTKCGFVARVGRKSPLGSKPRVVRVLRRGPVFDSHILDSLAAGVSVRSLRLKTGMAYYTFDRIMKDLGVGTKERVCDAPGLRLTSQILIKRRDRCRKTLSEYLAAHPDASRTLIAAELRNEYAWLVTHDREWYEARAPAMVGSTRIPPWLRPRKNSKT